MAKFEEGAVIYDTDGNEYKVEKDWAKHVNGGVSYELVGGMLECFTANPTPYEVYRAGSLIGAFKFKDDAKAFARTKSRMASHGVNIVLKNCFNGDIQHW